MAHSPSVSSEVRVIAPAPQFKSEEPETSYDNFYSPYNRIFYDYFRYATLNRSDHRIRLLRIHPHEANEDDNATVKCDLIENVSLGDFSGQFTTLSYCAGDPNKTELVLVNGFHFNAFANLGHALRQARHFWNTHHADREFLLWADQVCINQSDTSERSHQVSFMGDIYGAAERVLVCLSTIEDRSGGFAWLLQFASDALTLHDSESRHMEHKKMFELEGLRTSDEDLLSGFEVFQRTIAGSHWWSRAWVRQELIRSIDAYFLASHDSLDFQSLAAAIDLLNKHTFFKASCPHKKHAVISSESCQACTVPAYHTSSTIASMVPTSLALLTMKPSIGSTLSAFPDLLDNLNHVYHCNASDPRDLVYACLGYSSHSYGIEPDYTPGTSFCDVSCQLARNIIEYRDNFDVLKLSLHRRGDRDGEFPSWVPDWRSARYQGSTRADEKALARQYVSFHPDEKGQRSRVLHTRGVLLSADDTLVSSIQREGVDGNFLRDDEEVWLLQGSNEIFTFRPKGSYHELVGYIWKYNGRYSVPTGWINELATLVENNHPAVKTIRIC
jgi:hypothetical protein